jgi:4-hydroxybenzoate polyprenyltransferase
MSMGSDTFWFTERIWRGIVDLYNNIVFSSLLLSFECIAMAYVSCLIQDMQWNMTIVVIPFLAAFAIYNFNRKTDEDEDAINHKDRFAFTKRLERPLYYGAVLSMAICLLLSASFGILPLLATSAPFVLGFLYSFRLLPRSLGYQRLKEIPAVKNIVVGLAWGIPLAFLPVLLNQSRPDSTTMIAFFLFFLWGFMASMIPDIRDMEGDARAGVRTIPVIYGEGKTKMIITGILLVFGVPAMLFSFFFLPVFTTILLFAANAYSHCCVYLFGKVHLRNFVADALSDGQYIVLVLAMILVTQIYSLF